MAKGIAGKNELPIWRRVMRPQLRKIALFAARNAVKVGPS